MRHSSLVRLFTAGVALIASGEACGAGHVVNVGGAANSFSPQTITIDPGDSVTFINKGGFHNAVADDGSFRCARGCDGDGNGGSGGASSSLWIASITFTKPGTVGYFCEVHGAPGEGMFGTIIVNGAVAAPKPAVPIDTPVFLAILIGAIVAAALFLKRTRASSSRSWRGSGRSD
jgi:plastocyanin